MGAILSRMPTEVFYLAAALVEFTAITLLSRVGAWLLYISIAVNLLLITIFGAKLISIFGFVTNTGNIFYVATFVAVYFLIERYSEADAFRAIWGGLIALLLFMLLSQMTIGMTGVASSKYLEDAMNVLFAGSYRIALASLFAYLIGQYVNISIYTWLRHRTRGMHLWLRINGANIAGQLLDSAVFFFIAFIDTVPVPQLIVIALTGFSVKVLA